jgi:hypothetical protein
MPRFTLFLHYLPHFTLPFIICHILDKFLNNLPCLVFYGTIHFLTLKYVVKYNACTVVTES